MRVSTEPVFGTLLQLDTDADGAVTIRAAAGLIVEVLDNGNVRATSPIGAPSQWLEARPTATVTAEQSDGSIWVTNTWWDLQFIARARELEATL